MSAGAARHLGDGFLGAGMYSGWNVSSRDSFAKCAEDRNASPPLLSRMSINQSKSVARQAAVTLLDRHRRAAVDVVEQEILSRLAADDVQGALEMDQVRREVVFMLRD